jgi:hypothetical protein
MPQAGKVYICTCQLEMAVCFLCTLNVLDVVQSLGELAEIVEKAFAKGK